jgi:superfamily II DNA or RNA helicase
MSSKLGGVLRKFDLWPHQRQALYTIERYINAFSAGTTDKSALIQMPTGSGKSGVIAVTARCFPELGAVLVLTPRISLRNQLCRDIRERFFNHINFPTEKLPKDIERVDDGEVPSLDNDPASRVFVTTIQKLVSLTIKQPEIFQGLADILSLIIVDEGHYEPAKEWSKVIRAIHVPKVVFTATPYRNDFKVFNVDAEHAYVMSLRKGVNDRFLREVKVENRNTFHDPAGFVADVLAFYDEHFPEPGEDPPRVIVRCDDQAQIRHLAQAFLAQGRSVVGIHERFRSQGGEQWEQKSVPDPENEPAVFWIHQFKLLEGIDNPRFQVLALYKKIRSGRALVQQVGRIIRNPSQGENAIGYVLDHWKGHHHDLWKGFLAYDEALHSRGIETFHLSTGEGLLRDLIKLQPRTAYIDGRFRSEFDFSAIDPNKDVQLPLRTNLLEKLPEFNIDDAVDALKNLYEDKDRVAETYSPTPSTRVFLSVTCSNSIYLRNHAFMEADLHVAVLHEFDECVGVYESSGVIPMVWDDAGLGGPVDIKRLRRLFRQDQLSKLTSVSLKNSNLGASVIRSRSFTAASIESTVPGFDDYAQICTTAEGYSAATIEGNYDNGPTETEAKVRRYVGFSRGRVSQANSGYVLLTDYIVWLEKLNTILNSDTKPLIVLSRYALETKVPSKPKPRSLLLDISEISDDYHHIDSGAGIDIEDACLTVDNDGAVSFVANGENVSGKIAFDPARIRYILECSALDQRFFTKSDLLPGSIVKYTI